MNSNKIKGDKAEREAAALLSELLGIRVERRFGAGQKLDTGDLEGIPNTVVQVANLPLGALVELECVAYC